MNLSPGEYVWKICSEVVLKMETRDFGKSPVFYFGVPGMRQLKNKGPWELKDGGFCGSTAKKRM